jgi:hypothetical protein
MGEKKSGPGPSASPFQDAQLELALRDRDEAGDWFVAFRDHHLFACQSRLNQPGELRLCDVNGNLPHDSRSRNSRLANLANVARAARQTPVTPIA